MNTYEYDKNGNLTKKIVSGEDGPKTFIYTYDYENRLIKVEIQRDDNLKVITFAYDPFGRRIAKTVQSEEVEHEHEGQRDEDEQGRPRTTYYVYDNANILMEYNQKGEVTARYIHGIGIDEHLSVQKGDHTYYYHADGLGSIIALSDHNGKVVQRYDYDSFGNMRHHGHKVKQPYTYTGREYDSETGLYYYRARYYDPRIGIFMQKDPIGFLGGDVNLFRYVDSVGKPMNETNLYQYASNNPVNRIDPYGLFDNPLPKIPTFSERFPNSKYIAPTADIVAGGIEAGFSITLGVVSTVGLITGPENWWMPVLFGGPAVVAGKDAYGRLTKGIQNIGGTRCSK